MVLVKCRNVFVVKRIRRCNRRGSDVAFVQLDLHVSCYILLRLVNECRQSFTRGSKPLTEVHKIGEFSRKHLFQMCRFTIEGYRFKHFVRGIENCSSGSFVYAAALHSYKTVFDNVNDADTVLSADLVERFNQLYPGTFTVPEPIVAKSGMKIMSLAEPTRKMSKSDENPNAVVYILDDRDTIIRKFRRAVTDSDAVVRYAEGKDGINNLMTIYAALTGKDMAEIEREFDGRGYGDFKTAVGETCADVLAPVQERFKTYIADKAMLEAQMKKGAAEASYVARRTLSKVQKKLGFVQLH